VANKLIFEKYPHTSQMWINTFHFHIALIYSIEKKGKVRPKTGHEGPERE
jgi:hypothetical protein